MASLALDTLNRDRLAERIAVGCCVCCLRRLWVQKPLCLPVRVAFHPVGAIMVFCLLVNLCFNFF